MTFLAYLAAQGDANAIRLHECLSWLSDGPTSLSEVISLIRMSRSASEASLMEQEAVHRWREWRKIGSDRVAANWMPGRSLGEALDDPCPADDAPLRNMRSLAVRAPKLAKRLSRESSP